MRGRFELANCSGFQQSLVLASTHTCVLYGIGTRVERKSGISNAGFPLSVFHPSRPRRWFWGARFCFARWNKNKIVGKQISVVRGRAFVRVRMVTTRWTNFCPLVWTWNGLGAAILTIEWPTRTEATQIRNIREHLWSAVASPRPRE